MKIFWYDTDKSTGRVHIAPRFLAMLFIIIFICLGCSYTERVMPESTQEDFTFVIFPDTQYMVGPDYGGIVPDSGAKKEISMWESMCQWIVDHRSAENIKAVLSVGDVTDYASDAEFKIASEGYDVIDAAGIPFVPIVGNHDYDHVYPKKREISNFDRYFGPHRFEEKPWYGDSLNGSHANYYVRLTIDRWSFLILALEFFPRQHAVEWASDIIDAHPDAQAIILTHAYLNPDGTRTKETDRWSISRYGLEDSYSGEELWEGLIRSKPNILAVICGHQPDGPYAAHRTDRGDAGNAVHQIFIDYQSSNRGDGWIGLLKFRPSLGSIEMSSYRTYTPSGLGYDPDAPTYSLPWPGNAIQLKEAFTKVKNEEVVVFSIGSVDGSPSEFYRGNFIDVTVVTIDANGEVDPRLMPLRLINSKGHYSPRRSDAAETVIIRFHLPKSERKLIFRIARGGDSDVTVTLDSNQAHRVTPEMLGSGEGGIFGVYDLDLGHVQAGQHTLTIAMPEDGLGYNGSFRWDALVLLSR